MFSIWQPCPGLGGLCRQSFYPYRRIARVGVAGICPKKKKKSAQPDVQCSTSSSSPVEPPEFGGFGVVRGPFVSRFPMDAPERRTFPRRINNWVASPSEVILPTQTGSRDFRPSQQASFSLSVVFVRRSLLAAVFRNVTRFICNSF